MNGRMTRRAALSGLCVLALAAALGGCGILRGHEKGTKVLMIGNSFSICCMQHLPKVAADCGVDLDLASIAIGGCSMKRHWENVLKDEEEDDTSAPYLFRRNRFGRTSSGKINICEALQLAKWDIVTIQQCSHESWQEETYHPYGDDLVAKIRELAPQAKIYIQETWSYTPWDKRLKKWGIDQNEMYARLHAAYAAFAAKHGLTIIPFGTKVQEWRKRLPVEYEDDSFGGDVVGGGRQEEKDQFRRTVEGKWVPNCDVFHLNRKGEYFQALVWAVKLFGVDVSDLEFRPDYVSEADARLMKEIAMGH